MDILVWLGAIAAAVAVIVVLSKLYDSTVGKAVDSAASKVVTGEWNPKKGAARLDAKHVAKVEAKHAASNSEVDEGTLSRIREAAVTGCGFAGDSRHAKLTELGLTMFATRLAGALDKGERLVCAVPVDVNRAGDSGLLLIAEKRALFGMERRHSPT